MALMATSPDLLAESWLSPTPLHHDALPEDIWSKFDIEHDRALALANPEAMMEASHPMGAFSPVVGYTSTALTPAPAFHQGVSTLPTPPHSPPTEHDLDDLVASIPEILESPSATPPSDFSDILSDLEGMDATPLGAASADASASPSAMDWSAAAGCPSAWWTPPVAPPVPEESVKRDIMWGGGSCCPSLLEMPARKDRQVSECSADAALRDALRQDDVSEDEEDDSEDNLPDTPSGTDSDCDESLSEACSSPSGSPRSTNSASRYNAKTSFRTAAASTTTAQGFPSVNIEHNYCGRVPAPENHTMEGILTPSDTEDEVDVVSCNDQTENTSTPLHSTSTTTSTSSTRSQAPSKRSADVRRQLQLVIQEAMRNRQSRGAGVSSPEGEESPVSTTTTAATATTGSRFVSVKIKTQGKPAAYTKRMRDYHSEVRVMKTTKHRRRNRVESDEGRRSVHNSLERQRRVDLRNAFEYLRLLVPETKVLEKAPKVQILKKAALHCKQLQLAEERLLREKEKLKKQLEYLQQRRAAHSTS